MKKFIFLTCLTFSFIQINAQTKLNIFDLMEKMERRELNINEVETLAKKYFDSVGTEKGSGHKQYQRWLYEAKFHLDANGNMLPSDYEWNEYKRATSNMQRAMPTPPQPSPKERERVQNTNARVAGQWAEMGPAYINPISAPSPGVGRVSSVAVNPDNNLIIYVSSETGGIWKSVTGGNSWAPLMDFYSPNWMHIDNLAIDPSNTNTIYALVDYFYAGYGGGVIKSTDGGNTWFAAGSGASGVPGGDGKILIHPYNSDIVFVAGVGGIYRSTNAGLTWTQVHSESNNEDIEFNPTDPNIMYSSGRGNSGTSNCVWRSVNNGVTWSAVNGITDYGRTLLAVSPANPNVVYAVQANGSTFGKMYKSTDNGTTFITTITSDPTNDGVNHFAAASWAMAICANPLDADEVHIGSLSLLKSINGGTSFTVEANGYYNSPTYLHPDIQALEWIGTTIYCGSDGGISKSTDNGNTWTDLSTGLGIKQFYRIASSKTNGEVFNGGAQDNGSSIHKSTGWIDWIGGDGMESLVSPTNENLIWGTTQYGYVTRTTDGGLSEYFCSRPSPGNWVTPLAIESNTNIIYGGWTGVYRSTNLGDTWTKISGSVINSPLNCLAVAPSNPQYIYAYGNGGLHVTQNGGISWVTYPSTLGITSIAISPSNPEKIWIATNGYNGIGWVSVSTNAGATFTNISGNLPAITAKSIVVDDNANESVYVGMIIGVFYKDNTMTDWMDISNGLPLVTISELEIQKSSSILRVATYGRGVWENGLYNVPPPCSPPDNFTAQGTSPNNATISWNAVSGAAYYELKYKASSGYDWSLISGITTTSRSITGLSPTLIYDYQVRANCGDYSNVQYFSTSCGTSFSPPSGIIAQYITTNSAIISWNAVPGASIYDLQYKPSSVATWVTLPGITTTSYTLTDLSSSTVYDYRVSVNCSNYSTVQNFSTIVPCSTPPSGLNAQNITANTATVSWDAVSEATFYVVDYKKLWDSDAYWINAFTTTTTTVTLTGLNTSNPYNWRVRTNCSDYVTSTFTTTVNCWTPSNVTAQNITANSATIRWNSVFEANNYDLQYKPSSSSTWTTLSGIAGTYIPPGYRSYDLMGLYGGITYDYRVRSNCTGTNSNYSTIRQFFTLCGTSNPSPSGISAQNITSNSATINWNAVPGAIIYDLLYKASSCSTWTTLSGITTTSYNLTGLSPNTGYDYTLRANCGQYSTVQNFSTLCEAPSNLNAQNTTVNSATVSWGVVNGAANYDLAYKPNSISAWTTVSGITTASYNLTGLSGSTTYDYKVKASCGDYSTAQNFLTLAPCETPSGLSAQSITNISATLSWNAVNGDDNYDLLYRASSDPPWVWTSVYGITTPWYELTGLLPATTYEYHVIGHCTVGSTSSASAQFTTPACLTTYDSSPNGTIFDAAQIPLNTNVNGFINPVSDYDYYKFILASGGNITVSLTTLPFNYDLRLLNSGAALIAGSYNTGTTNEIISVTLSAGTYYAQVHGVDMSSIPPNCYTLRVQQQTGGGGGDGGGKGEIVVQRIYEVQSPYSIFPNPAKNTLNITLAGTDETKTIHVFDVYGRLVMSEATMETATLLDVNKLPNGLYFLSVISANGEFLFREKFVKE